MSRSTLASKDIKTQGYVLRRTNYGEADRILDLITPEGKIAVIAKSVRKSRSKLAGGVEMFTLAEYNIHRGKSELGVLTSAKMIRHYGGIVKDLARMELAAEILKYVSRAAEGADSADYFKIVDKGLAAVETEEKLGMVEAWFLLNLARIMGEEVNLYRDTEGEKLLAGQHYMWDGYERAFIKHEWGEYGANEIKLLRIMITSDYGLVKRVKIDDGMAKLALKVARTMKMW